MWAVAHRICPGIQSLCVSHELGMNLDSYTGGRARKCHSYPIPLFSTFILDGRAFTLLKVVESPVDFSVTTCKSKAISACWKLLPLQQDIGLRTDFLFFFKKNPTLRKIIFWALKIWHWLSQWQLMSCGSLASFKY